MRSSRALLAPAEPARWRRLTQRTTRRRRCCCASRAGRGCAAQPPWLRSDRGRRMGRKTSCCCVHCSACRGRSPSRLVRRPGVRPARDGSNRNLRFARNRVRRRVLPELERINPSVRSLLAGFALSARDDDALLAALAADAIAGAEKRSDGEVSWPRGALAGLPLPLFARVAQDAFRHVCGAPAALSRARVTAMQRLAAASHGGELALGGGVRFVVEQEMCRIAGPALSPAQPGAVPLTTPGTTAFGGWELTAELTARPPRRPHRRPVAGMARRRCRVGRPLCPRPRSRRPVSTPGDGRGRASPGCARQREGPAEQPCVAPARGLPAGDRVGPRRTDRPLGASHARHPPRTRADGSARPRTGVSVQVLARLAQVLRRLD